MIRSLHLDIYVYRAISVDNTRVIFLTHSKRQLLIYRIVCVLTPILKVYNKLLQVVLHAAHEVPLVTELSYGVAPGFQSSFALSKSLVGILYVYTGHRWQVTGHRSQYVDCMFAHAECWIVVSGRDRLPTDHSVFGTRKGRLYLKYDTLQFILTYF